MSEAVLQLAGAEGPVASSLLPTRKRTRIQTWCVEVSRLTFECSCTLPQLASTPSSPASSTDSSAASTTASSELCTACTRQALLAAAAAALAPPPPAPTTTDPSAQLTAPHPGDNSPSTPRSLWKALKALARAPSRRRARRRERQRADAAAARARANLPETLGFPPLDRLELLEDPAGGEDQAMRTDMYVGMRDLPADDDDWGGEFPSPRSDGELGPGAARLMRAARLWERAREKEKLEDVTA